MPASRRSDGVWRFVRDDDAAWQRERLLIVVLNQQQAIASVREVPPGRRTIAGLRRVFRGTDFAQAAGLISIHYQPSASPLASDSAITMRLQAFAEELGVPLLDHLIFHRGRYDSMVNGRRAAPSALGVATRARSRAPKVPDKV